MKRTFALLLAAMMIFALAACGEDTTTPTTPTGEKELELGKVNGQTWENEFIGIGCTLDAGWTFKTEDEIKEMNNLAMDMATDDLANLLKDADLIYDMAAATGTGLSNMMVSMQKLNSLQIASLNIANELEKSYELTESSLINMGCANLTHSISTITFDGKTFDALVISASISGLTMNQTTFAIKCNGYLASVSIATVGEYAMADLIDNFYVLD